MTGKKWFQTFLSISLAVMILLGGMVFVLDPFFHYRAPNSRIYYKLYDQRSQNDGITRFFDYDAIVTGTSMAENFRASDFDRLFGTNCIKVTYAGATFKEINDNLKVAYDSGHQVKYVLRPIDYTLLTRGKDELRTDMGEYPVWLTNDNPFDDVKYLLNRDVIINYALPCLLNLVKGQQGGHTSFDEYSFNGDYDYSRESVLSGRKEFLAPEVVNPLTDEELETLRANMEQNVISIAREHPETTFLCFLPPYSMAYWGSIREDGDLDRMLALVEEATRLMMECDNIHVYSFNLETNVTENLDLYRDAGHYNPDINAWILETIAECEKGGGGNELYRLTGDNYNEHYRRLGEQLKGYDYNSLIQG